MNHEPASKKPRKTRVKAELSIFDDEMTAQFNPTDFIPDAPSHTREPVRVPVPSPIQVPVQIAVQIAVQTQMPKSSEVTVEREVKTEPKMMPLSAPPTSSYSLEPPEMVLSLVEEDKSNGSAKVRFYNPTSRELSAVLRTPLPPMKAWQLNLLGKRLQPALISKGALTISVKPGSLMSVELVFANC